MKELRRRVPLLVLFCVVASLVAQGPVRLLEDLNRYTPGVSSHPRRFALGGDFLYADAVDANGARRIVRILADGSGTAQVAATCDLGPFTFGSSSASAVLAATSAGALFVVRAATEDELWFTDGDPGHAEKIAGLADHVANVDACVVAGRIVYAFTANSSTEVWSTAGTAASTQLLATQASNGSWFEFTRAVAATGDVKALLRVATTGEPVVIETDGTIAGTATTTVPGLLTTPGMLANGTLTWARAAGRTSRSLSERACRCLR